MPEGWRLILIAVAGMVILLWLIIRLKLHALVALVLVSVGLGLAAGMTPTQVLDSVQRGMGGTLGAIALLVGLGSMFGQMLEVSGGAEIVAQRLIGAFGQKRAPWALGLTGFIVSIPIFFDVAFVILVPIVYGLSRRAGQPIVFYGVPLIAGMAVTHAFVPPTPGPIAVAGLLGADLGYVILFGVLAGIPAMIIAGPLYGRWIARRVTAGVPQYIQAPAHERRDRPASRC
jgi:Gnt-I system low-affinity gluconate transporter